MKHMIYKFLIVLGLPVLLTASTIITPPSILKKDVKNVCKCYEEFVDLESKDFPKSSPYYQEARAKATTALVQVEKHIQEGKYSREDFNKWIKKKCQSLVKKINELHSDPAHS